MDARDRLYRKKAVSMARQYAAIKRGYITPEEKKAFKIAEKMRRDEWEKSLAAFDADERRARSKAFSTFKRCVFFAYIFPKKRQSKLSTTPKTPENGHIYF